MDENKMGFFNKIFKSIAGFNHYKYFIKQKAGKAVVYLLLLSLILGIANIVRPVIDYNAIINEMISGFENQVPDFTFENGKLDVKGNMPIIMGEGNSTIIIDTTGQTDESFLDNYDQAILITSDKMIQKNYANKRITDFSSLQGFAMNKESAKRLLPILKWGIAFVIIFGVLFFIIGKFISALIISIIGLILNGARKTNLLYKEIFTISVYSMTLPLLIGTLFDLLAISIPYFELLFYIIAAVYLYGAINAIKNDAKEPPFPPIV